MKCLVKVISFMALCACVSEVSNVYCVNYSSGAVAASGSPSANQKNNSNSKSGSGLDSFEWEDPDVTAEAEKEREKAELYPFTPAEGQIDKEDVVGIKLKKNKIIYFSNDITFYAEAVQEGENFSKLDSFSQYPNLLSVEFCDSKISTKELENIRDFLASSQVKVLSFDSCIIKEEDAQLIAETISKQNSLMALTVKFIRTEKKRKGRKNIDVVSISPEAWQSITEAISEKKNLVQLNVACGDITADSCNHIASALDNSKKLSSLLLCWNSVSGDSAEDANKTLATNLSELKDLTKLCVSILEMPDNHIDALFKGMAPLKQLTELTLFVGNLRDCRNIYDLSAALGQSLEGFTKLSSLQIQNMELSSNAMQAIAKSMSKMTELTYLDISNNEVNLEAANLLSDSLEKAEGLKVFIARNCHMESFGELKKIISDSELEIVCFGGNTIGDKIADLQLPESTVYIDLTGNNAPADSIITFLKTNLSRKGLKAIDLRNNSNLTEEQRDEIERLQADNGSTAAVLLYNPKSEKKKKKSKNNEVAANKGNRGGSISNNYHENNGYNGPVNQVQYKNNGRADYPSGIVGNNVPPAYKNNVN